jgi:hypothetical protein
VLLTFCRRFVAFEPGRLPHRGEAIVRSIPTIER